MRSKGWLAALVIVGLACGDDDGGSDAGIDAGEIDAGDDASAIDAATADAERADTGTDRVPGCGRTTYPNGASTEASIEHDGVTRTFRVHVPPSYDADAPTPLVLMFHGGFGSGRQLENGSGMSVVADREGFLAVYPDGTGAVRTWNGGGCCNPAARENVDDVGFVDALLDHLESELCVDRARVFSSGMSNGGILSHRLACELSDRIAAIAPVAGTIMIDPCTPTRPVHVMQIHGTDDGHVPWEGGFGCGPSGADYTSVPDTLEGWRTRNACDATTTETFAMGDGTCDGYEGCADGGDTWLCAIEGGGHSWPGTPRDAELVECPEDGAVSTTFFASDAIWRFFSTRGR